jgi:signal transduction histidine kinase
LLDGSAESLLLLIDDLLDLAQIERGQFAIVSVLPSHLDYRR